MPQHHIPLWLLLSTLASGIMEEHQYCSLRYRRLCQGKGRHVACQFPDPGPSISCKKYAPIRFTNELKHFITNFINRRRQRIAGGYERVRGGVHIPKPEVMMMVEWDRELASLAQRLADQCHFVHDECRATVRYPYAGQTVGEVRWRRSSESDELTAQRAIRRVLDAWWGEKRRVQPGQLVNPFRLTHKGTLWGDFSQLAVWNLQAVGCGAARHGAFHSRLLLVCDFSHTNMLGQSTLVPGPMAACPIHFARRSRTAYPLLCAPVRHHIPHGQEIVEDQYDDAEDIGPDADDDPVEMSEMPSPHDRWKTSFTPQWTKESDTPEDEDYLRVLRVGEEPQKGVLITELERNVEAPLHTEKYQLLSRKHKQRQWESNERPLGRWRQDHDNTADTVSVAAATQPAPAVFSVEYWRRNTVEETQSEPRQRWKQPRNRPQRPGANALLFTSTPKQEQSRKPAVASLTLDKDDFMQLFRDTGFSRLISSG